MTLPQEFIQSLQGIPGFDEIPFIAVHESDDQVTSVRFNPLKKPPAISHWPVRKDFNKTVELLPLAMESIPWTQEGYYLSSRPAFTFDPLFHAGCYYVQEASGMFLEEAIRQVADLTKKIKVLDLCASPGGKTTHLQSVISSESLLVSNEVIRSRATILKENVLRWGAGNIIVTNNDPAEVGRLTGYFDVMVVDAPCSGSGLFRKDEEAIRFWSPAQVEHCSLRQKRILSDAWPSLKNGGILIYCTCSFSREEDEEILDWLQSQFSVTPLKLDRQPSWNIIETQASSGAWGYRFWPDKLKGEGFFLACFQKLDGEDSLGMKIKIRKEVDVSAKDREIVDRWMGKANVCLRQQDQFIVALPESLEQDVNFIFQQLKIIYSGIIAGEIVHGKLIPDHSLAMSKWIDPSVPEMKLDYHSAIAYLQRKEIIKEPGASGWKLATYLDQHLGWVNVLPNRINNYYPKELRILKDR